MVGGKGLVDSPTWFLERFGFSEPSGSLTTFKETQSKFSFADGVLTSKATSAKFRVGAFETPSLSELRLRLGMPSALGLVSGLTFENTTGCAKTLHLDPDNADAVFQVASQFNCLEMTGPRVRPEDGVTRYYCDATQGPACALACPAATVFRNYFVNGGKGQAGKGQIDCLMDIGALVRNDERGYWVMHNGYCLPRSAGSIGKLSQLLQADPDLAEAVRARLRVGIHWDTEVKVGHHGVCQVFCSALPVAYAKGTKCSDWAAFATAVLDATYEATLAAATLLAQARRSRVKVYLTVVGGGAFGNPSPWITGALAKALAAFDSAPLDVRLVHRSTIPRGNFTRLATGSSTALPRGLCGYLSPGHDGGCQWSAQASPESRGENELDPELAAAPAEDPDMPLIPGTWAASTSRGMDEPSVSSI